MSGRHLNPHLIVNVKYALSPFLSPLNKWPHGTEWDIGGEPNGCEFVFVCSGVYNLAFIFINLSFFNSLHPSGEERANDRTALDENNQEKQ